MPKVSEAHLQARRRQILDAARRVFAHHGYEGATVARLEEETGLSRGAIFNYFDSKWEIFFALAEEDAERAARLWLEGGWEAVVEHVAGERPEWVAVYLEHARRLRTDPELRERWLQRAPEFQRELERALAEAQARGELRSDLTVDELGQFLSLVVDGIALHTSFGAPVDVPSVLQLVRSAIAPA